MDALRANAVKTVLEQAVLTVHGACDGVRSLDGMGWSRYDRERGEQFANRIQAGGEFWGWKYRSMFRLVTRYKNTQLARAGIVLPTAEEVEELVSFIDGTPIASPDTTSPAELPVQQKAPGRLSRDGNQLVICFDYNPERVAAAKAIKQAYWRGSMGYDKFSKCWRVIWCKGSVADALKAFPDFERDATVEAEYQWLNRPASVAQGNGTEPVKAKTPVEIAIEQMDNGEVPF